MTAVFAGELGTMADEETGIAGEFVLCLGNDLNDKFLGDDLTSGSETLIDGVSSIQLHDDAAGVRGVGRLQRLKGTVLGFLDLGTNLIVISCHGL